MVVKGQIFILTGPSGVGKTEILKKLLVMPELNLQKVITCTTRDKRDGEKDGKDYFFISKEEFLENLRQNKMFESAEVYGNYYGSRKSDVENILNSGKNVLFQIDPQGAENLKKMNEHCKVIFVQAENLEELKNRLVGRGLDSEEALEKRISAAKKEMEDSEQFDYIVTNRHGKIGEAIQEVAKIIQDSSKNI